MVDFGHEVDFGRLLWVVFGELYVKGEITAFVGGIIKAVESADPFEDVAMFELDVIAVSWTFSQALEFLFEAFLGVRHDSQVMFVSGLRIS